MKRRMLGLSCLILLIIFLHYGDAIHCQTCFALNGRSCNSTSEIKDCGWNSACETKTFTEIIDNKQIYFYQKQCRKSMSECQASCDQMSSASLVDCKVSCCDEEECNKEIQEQIIWYGLLTSSGDVIIHQMIPGVTLMASLVMARLFVY